MNDNEFVKGALLTESNDFKRIASDLDSEKNIRLLHAGMGMVTEAGEFLDQLKKVIFYGKEMDEVNLVEELGDLLWYMAIAVDELKTDLATVKAINNKKLTDKKLGRYKKGAFTSIEAVAREIENERKILEGK